MLHPLITLFSSKPITNLQQVLLTISKPIINLTAFHLSCHMHHPSQAVFLPALPMDFLLLFLLFCHISGYVTLPIEHSIDFLQNSKNKIQTSAHYFKSSGCLHFFKLIDQDSLPCFLCCITMAFVLQNKQAKCLPASGILTSKVPPPGEFFLCAS